ncbi:hypothetical protein ACQKIE_09325 [Luteibacter sp. NPDC031894]|uniref:hypothetical protein n=1 Tax=Luteibacter sp. NPDC031894 TaxID=3390572 RepID=UPI003D048140
MNDESDFLEGEGARASSLKSVHKLSVRDPHHDLQLLRDLEIINARTEAELGKLPHGGVPVTPSVNRGYPRPRRRSPCGKACAAMR